MCYVRNITLHVVCYVIELFMLRWIYYVMCYVRCAELYMLC